MKGMIKTIGIFLAGMIANSYIIGKSVDDGDVVYEDDNMYVTAAKGKSYGYSFARVNWKNPIKED